MGNIIVLKYIISNFKREKNSFLKPYGTLILKAFRSSDILDEG